MLVTQTVRPPPLVLMVDAHEDTREMCGCLLRQLHGFAVQDTATACNALRMVAESAPDVIVTEMALPGVEGYELCRRLREHSTMRATPIRDALDEKPNAP